ncbi:hypothetical protein BDP27DRAFT_1413366 [Rhodocollybia butyracea]|uniref:Uncharacterized protein n=1 Tax=Rhodocollybia butyracea TaxID=206335 RepID=A0A9P5QAE5_9AGAR|nr:hypothetical protein BDP27DRAFT_1413366 [Rhodocollybia butyracea]
MNLPAELYRPIVGYVKDCATLLSLLLTSHLLNAEAERSLYYKFEHVHNVRSQVLFLQRAVDCPRVAQYVHSYKFEMDWRTNIGTKHIFWNLLPKAWRAFVNLKILHFRTNGGMVVEGLLSGCTFQLEHCHWRCRTDEAQMQIFLESQTKLKCLSLCGWDDENFLAPSNHDKQPDLRQLAGSYGVIHAFLPGRHITHVEWISDMEDPWDIATGLDVAGLASSLRKLRSLKLGGPPLCVISDHLTNLVFLELVGYDSPEIEDQAIFTLSSLKVLRISIQWGLRNTYVTNPRGHATKMFAKSRSLQIIEIEEESTRNCVGNRVQQYGRWERDIGLVNKWFAQIEMWPAICEGSCTFSTV